MFDEFETNSHGEYSAGEWSGEADEVRRYRSGSAAARRPAYSRRPARKPAQRSHYRYGRPLGFNGSVFAIEPPREYCHQDGGNIEAEPDSEIGPFSATLRWVKRPQGSAPAPGDDYVMTLAQAQKAAGGGVYIMLGDAGGGGEKNKLLKVGKAEFFASRFAGYKIPGWNNLRVYIARIDRFIPKDAHIERALARLLYRAITKTQGTTAAGWPRVFPASRYVPPKQVLGRVSINNILPPPLLLQYGITQNQLSLDASTTKSYEIAPVNSASSGASRPARASNKRCSCQSCRLAPCQCGSKQCFSGCSCAKCQLARGAGNATGRWLRQGNQIQLTGVLP